jgi:F-type H+-transporting ATPase subunit a
MFIEVISHLARPVALALRLFGNILAGEILLTVMGSLVPIVLPSFVMVFELFVGVVQALIFALLTLAFLSMATTHGAHEEAAIAHH